MRELSKTEKEVLRGIMDELRSSVGMFNGNYDAAHGSNRFMFGIATVMECLAYMVSEEYGDTFSEEFTDNMIISEGKI